MNILNKLTIIESNINKLVNLNQKQEDLNQKNINEIIIETLNELKNSIKIISNEKQEENEEIQPTIEKYLNSINLSLTQF